MEFPKPTEVENTLEIFQLEEVSENSNLEGIQDIQCVNHGIDNKFNQKKVLMVTEEIQGVSLRDKRGPITIFRSNSHLILIE